MSLEDSHRNPVTLTRFLLEEQRHFPQATGEFSALLNSVQLACKVIASAVGKAGIANLYGLAGDKRLVPTNSSGEEQKKLDVFANETFINCTRFSNQVFAMGSEEVAEPILLKESIEGGYGIVFDPLDGSSNIDANMPVGTIFAIYKKISKEGHKTSVKDLLRPGSELISAGYAIYGSATMLVLSTGCGVNGFTLDSTIGEFILTHPNIRMPTRGNIYSINEGNYNSWDDPVKSLIAKYKKPQKHTGKPKVARYVGSMVADVHRTLLYGGIFMYPPDAKNPKGKLRLLYECNPMAMLIEQAGGKATTGTQRVLDIQPTHLHQRVPVFLGSKQDVEEVEWAYKSYKMQKQPTPSSKTHAEVAKVNAQIKNGQIKAISSNGKIKSKL